jgi:nucleotide-binding universal stress UspA family protein
VGADSRGGLKEFLFGSKAEEIQTRLPNNMLIVGPNCIRN